MKTISIEQVVNGYTVNVYTRGADAHPVDMMREAMVFHNSADVIQYVTETLKQIDEREENA